MIPYPEWLPTKYNSGLTVCDMLIGHCACGAYHLPDQAFKFLLTEHNNAIEAVRKQNDLIEKYKHTIRYLAHSYENLYNEYYGKTEKEQT